MAPELSRFVRQVTFALVILAAAATEIAAEDTRPVMASLGLATVWVGVAALLGWLVPPPADGGRMPPRFVQLVLLLLTAAPFVIEPLRRRWTDAGYPLELQMVFGLRNLAVGLAAFSAWRLCLRLACVASLFLMLFAIAMTDHPAVLTLLGLYSAAGSVWLMLVYWSGLRRFFVASETAVAVEVQPGRERLPWLAAVIFTALAAGVLGLIAVGPQQAARALGEWLPTSGGTGGYDPFARGGLNDGDDEVKGDNARSTGMTQADNFLDSPLPSLYDMFNDMYGEPFKPKEVQRAIALDAQSKVKESTKPPAHNLRPSREFATTRKSPRQPRDPSDQAARAVFEVEGRTPLHVRVTAFDVFDGIAWHEATLHTSTCLLEKERNSCWMVVQQRKPPAIFAETESHQFKITDPTGSLLPTPPHLERFRLGRVNRAEFFGWGQDRVLRLAHRKTPSGVVVETLCRTVHPRRLQTLQLPRGSIGEPSPYAALPTALPPEVAALARRWAEGHPEGWPQAAAVVQHLRTEYALDPAARVPDDCMDPLGHFLLHTRRGPDYQFATAAAVLLRVLGYQTRLMSGFYVAPGRYDPRTRHTPVVREDLHFWAEVMLPCGDWLVVEPTPGYEVLGPNLAWSEQLWAAVVAVAHWSGRHAVGLSLGLIFVGVLWWFRREAADAAAAALWRWFPGRTWRQCVGRAVWLLQRRGRWVGRPRPTCQTVPAWLRSVFPQQTSAETALGRLTALAEWAAYAADLEPPWGQAEVVGVCRHVLDAWTLRQWRTAAARNGA
jgi:transglutaminase-like putative cysteine protease